MERSRIVLSVALVALALSGGFVVGRFSVHPAAEERPQLFEKPGMSETRVKGEFRYINPLLECDQMKPLLRPEIRTLEAELEVYVREAKSRLSISHVSYYYRDLNNGVWIGSELGKAFAPASLLKVPILIAALKVVESNPGLLEKKFSYDSSVYQDHIDPNLPDEQIVFGKSYTLRDLMERMIINSDNTAKNMIMGIIGDDKLMEVWKDLGVPEPAANSPEDFITVKDYSSFFRILYNATYLNRELSEMALEILSRTRFDVGLAKGVPNGVELSNKFGERGFSDSNIKQLHDCGIVYAQGSPYLVCVMTRGVDWQNQAELIAEISRKVYEAHMAPLHRKE
jgi:beta-lactamase class A